MLIVIAGDGSTGTHLAKVFSGEAQDIVLIGSDQGRLDELESAYNFITFNGCPTNADDLRQCGIERAALFVAVTPDENMNIVACELARSLGARKCAARVDSPSLADDRTASLLRQLGVDVVFVPEQIAARSISRFVANCWVTESMTLRQGRLSIVGVRIDGSCPVSGKSLREVSAGVSRRNFHIAAIRRGESIIIPTGHDVVTTGDVVYFSVLLRDIDEVRSLCGKESLRPRQIMIAGGGRITENVLRQLGDDYNITVIEADRERSLRLAAMFGHAVIVNAGINDVHTLRDEGIDKCDIFMALTGNSEANMVACMVAREHGVRRTVARIEELQYIPEAESLCIDKIINKKRLNASQVLDIMLDTGSAGGQCMSIDGAEIATISATEGSRIVSRPVSQLDVPHGVTVAGLVRDGEGMLVDGNTQIRPGDMVVVLFLAGKMSKVRKLFI